MPSTRSTCASTAGRCGRTSIRISAAASAEYYADLTAAIAEIGEPVLLAGHSTGALICALYAHEGEARASVRALWLNSAFFDWRLPAWRSHAAAPRRRARAVLSVPQGRESAARGLREEPARRGMGVRPRAQAAARLRRVLRLARRDDRRPRQACTAASRSAARCSPCIRTRPISCSTGATSPGGRAPSARTSR